MMRVCIQCGTEKTDDAYSNNQFSKGDGVSRCRGCVAGYSHHCQQCHKYFAHPNQLKMHMQIHRLRHVACPLCNEGHFRSDANAVQHIEGGFCSGCRGQTNLSEQLKKYASSRPAMQAYLSNADSDVPYMCHRCSHRPFKQLGQFLQHQDNKHDFHPVRIQYFKSS